MALGDYILCCECECKLIYDGDRDKREWWHDRWGKEPQIKCPDCETPQRTWVGLTDDEIDQGLVRTNYAMQTAGAWRDGVEWAQSQLKEQNT